MLFPELPARRFQNLVERCLSSYPYLKLFALSRAACFNSPVASCQFLFPEPEIDDFCSPTLTSPILVPGGEPAVAIEWSQAATSCSSMPCWLRLCMIAIWLRLVPDSELSDSRPWWRAG